MTDETYNGWTNKATWLVKLWIDNDQGEQELWAARAASQIVDDEGGAPYRLAEELESYFDEAAADLTGVTGFFSDLMSYALACVNWGEVAYGMIEDAKELA